jgi:probable rRNA maturation factor
MSYAISLEIDDEFIEAVDGRRLEAAAIATLQDCGCDTGELTIVITNDQTVRLLNLQFRGIDASTDVLSFPFEETEAEEDGALDEDESSDSAARPTLIVAEEMRAEIANYLGDVIIAYPYSAAQALRFNNSIDDELQLLVVHGVLHLLGYDHATPEEEAVMWQRQSAILAKFGCTIEMGERV